MKTKSRSKEIQKVSQEEEAQNISKSGEEDRNCKWKELHLL